MKQPKNRQPSPMQETRQVCTRRGLSGNQARSWCVHRRRAVTVNAVTTALASRRAQTQSMRSLSPSLSLSADSPEITADQATISGKPECGLFTVAFYTVAFARSRAQTQLALPCSAASLSVTLGISRGPYLSTLFTWAFALSSCCRNQQNRPSQPHQGHRPSPVFGSRSAAAGTRCRRHLPLKRRATAHARATAIQKWELAEALV
jgi:hypothetical protein